MSHAHTLQVGLANPDRVIGIILLWIALFFMLSMQRERVVFEYQLQNRVENLADVSTRCSGLLQGEDKLA